MLETTARYATEAFDELVTALNNLNQEIQNPESTIAKIDYLLTKSSKASELLPKFDDALKACNLCDSNPEVSRLRMLFVCLRDIMLSPKQLAGIGIDYLEKAILKVLFEARETTPEDPYVRRVDIIEKIGGGHWNENGWSVRQLLKNLEEKGCVEQREVRGPWKLTEVEYKKRC